MANTDHHPLSTTLSATPPAPLVPPLVLPFVLPPVELPVPLEFVPVPLTTVAPPAVPNTFTDATSKYAVA